MVHLEVFRFFYICIHNVMHIIYMYMFTCIPGMEATTGQEHTVDVAVRLTTLQREPAVYLHMLLMFLMMRTTISFSHVSYL